VNDDRRLNENRSSIHKLVVGHFPRTDARRKERMTKISGKITLLAGNSLVPRTGHCDTASGMFLHNDPNMCCHWRESLLSTLPLKLICCPTSVEILGSLYFCACRSLHTATFDVKFLDLMMINGPMRLKTLKTMVGNRSDKRQTAPLSPDATFRDQES
jgi:hypothetical protein